MSITHLLVESGAEIEASTWMGATPLHVASDEGHSEVVRALCEAGADVDTRKADRSTPLISAVIRGHANSTRELLRAKANPLSVKPNAVGKNFTPLDAAALHGRAEVTRELITQVSIIRGCAGPSGGVDALEVAAQGQHVEILAMLTGAGVVDPGIALNVAADCGHEAAVKFLLQAQSHIKRRITTGQASYVNILDAHGASPLIGSIDVDVDLLCMFYPGSCACSLMPEQTRDRYSASPRGARFSSTKRPSHSRTALSEKTRWLASPLQRCICKG